MAVSQQVKIEKKAGKPNLEKLLIPTEFHPRGRIQIDPETGQVAGAKNNIIDYKERIIRHESGVEIGRVKIAVNGGHVTEEGSIWRIGLKGPAKYHYRVLDDAYKLRARGKQDRSAPELEYEEAKEYHLFIEYLRKEGLKKAVDEQLEGKKMSPQLQEDFETLNSAFYDWLKAKKAEVVVKDDEVGVKYPPKPKAKKS